MLQIAIICFVLLIITLIAKSRGFAIICFFIDLYFSYRSLLALTSITSDSDVSIALAFTNILITAIILAFIPVICAIVQLILYRKYEPVKATYVILVNYLTPLGANYSIKFHTDAEYKTFAKDIVPRGYKIISAQWVEETK